MRTTLRARFVIWLVTLSALCFGVQLVAFLSYELHEIRSDPTIEREEEREEALVLVGSMVVSIPIIALAVWFISGRMLRPIHSIATTANRIRAGNLRERIPAGPVSDDLGRLTLLLNDAFDRYDDAVERLDRFTSDASHQLRTPLSAMRTTGEVALHRERTAEEYRETLAAMLDEVQRLTVVVEQLLTMARLEADSLRRRFTVVPPAVVARDAVQRLADRSRARGVAIRVDCNESVRVLGDEGLLDQAVTNLVDNAIRHSPASGVITVRVAERKGLAVIEVLDGGPGVPASFKPKLFQRFSRSPDSASPGSGLGLAIVADIARLHRGSVEVADNQPSGAVFRLVIPSVEQPSGAGAGI